MNFETKNNGLLWRSPEGYVIRRGLETNPSYWTAFKPGGLSPANELAAGAGDQGWLKCKRYCEEHLAKAAEQASSDAHPATANRVPQPLQAPAISSPTARLEPSSKNDSSSKQQQLL